MRILLDECLDWRLRRDLPGHDVKTVQEMGWAPLSYSLPTKLAIKFPTKFFKVEAGGKASRLPSHSAGYERVYKDCDKVL